MYIPHLNKMTGHNEIVSFMQRFSFASIITSDNNYPQATHLPFLVATKDNEIILTSHFAKANDQWQKIEQHTNLVIFTEPHAYISPAHYEKELNVPTWNYIAVHAYGKAAIVSEPDGVRQVLEETIQFYEAAYRLQWDGLPENYKAGLANGIVAFKIVVTDLQAKKKLSQNKTLNEQQNIIHTLSQSSESNEQHIAEYMQNNLTQP